MPGARLYVGGLSDRVDEEALRSKLSSSVSVSDVNLKEKTDAEGNVVFRFAYVSVEGTTSQIEECMRQLNGTSWLGSRLRIEPAKESFLDRLKRERATIQQQQPSHATKIHTLPEKAKNEFKRPQKDSEADAIRADDNKKIKENARLALEDAEYIREERMSKREKKCPEKYLITDKDDSRKKDEAEEEMLSSFKSFSSVWADSDSENEDKSVDEKNDNKKAEGIDGCETSEADKYVKVAKGLNFGQKSSEFSLLAQFSQQREAVGEDRVVEEVRTTAISAPSRPVQQHHYKEKEFFVAPSDPNIEAAIRWMAQSLTEEISQEFREAQPHLRDLYKTRALRALKKQRDFRRGRGTGSRNPSRPRS